MADKVVFRGSARVFGRKFCFFQSFEDGASVGDVKKCMNKFNCRPADEDEKIFHDKNNPGEFSSSKVVCNLGDNQIFEGKNIFIGISKDIVPKKRIKKTVLKKKKEEK